MWLWFEGNLLYRSVNHLVGGKHLWVLKFLIMTYHICFWVGRQRCLLFLILGNFMPQFQGRLTYGKIGEWRFDKRSFDRIAPPRNLPLPPPGVPQSVVSLTCVLLCHTYKATREHFYKLKLKLKLYWVVLWNFRPCIKILVLGSKTIFSYFVAGNSGENGKWSHIKNSKLGVIEEKLGCNCKMLYAKSSIQLLA